MLNSYQKRRRGNEMVEKYYIKQGDYYFAKTKINNSFLTKDIANAWCASEYSKAAKQIDVLPKVVRMLKWKVEYVDVSKLSEVANQISFPEYTEVDLNGLLTQLDEITQKSKVITGNKQWLLEKESTIDKRISDILHYLEFYPISASDGYKLSKQLQDLRRERRQVKNELHAIGVINSGCAQIINSSVQNSIRGMEHRQYTPRIEKDIFLKNKNRN